MCERTAQAQPGEPQSVKHREGADRYFEECFIGRRERLPPDQTNCATNGDARRVQCRPDHPRHHSFKGTGSKTKVCPATLCLKLCPALCGRKIDRNEAEATKWRTSGRQSFR